MHSGSKSNKNEVFFGVFVYFKKLGEGDNNSEIRCTNFSEVDQR